MRDKKLVWLMSIALIAAIFAWLVIGLGAFTRLTDAGLGCPDWPGCYGKVTVPAALAAQATPLAAHKAWTEMIHRYFAGTLALLLIGVAVLCVLNAVRHGVSYLVCAFLIFVLVVYQALLGMWTVTLKLWPIVVSQHLLGGMSLLALVWVIHLKAHADRTSYYAKNIKPAYKWIALLGLLLVSMQIILGAWTSTNYAALSCPDFPYCKAHWTQSFDFVRAFNVFSPLGVNYEGGVLSEVARQTIHMMHRVLALCVVLYAIFMAVYFARHPLLRRVMIVLLLVLILQVALGIMNIVLALPLVIAVMHNLVAALLLCAMVAVNFIVFRRVK